VIHITAELPGASRPLQASSSLEQVAQGRKLGLKGPKIARSPTKIMALTRPNNVI
jgi:hypothetical protein